MAFEMTYYKAYIEATRLITEFEVLMNSTACEDEVSDECKEADTAWNLKSEKSQQKLTESLQKLNTVKGHISMMSKAEARLTAHIKTLTETCVALDETVSDLDKVRDAIHIFDQCAGIGRPNFHIPAFTGQIVEIEYDTTARSDAEIDADLNALCRNITYDGLNARSAEISEIMQQSVSGMPSHNTAEAPLLGTCPHCAGDPDVDGGPTHASGHARNCWDAGAPLNGETMRSNCGHLSYKAVMCVVDRFNFGNETTGTNEGSHDIGSGTSSSGSLTSTSSSESSSSSSESSSSTAINGR
jgi:hypothetical protein